MLVGVDRSWAFITSASVPAPIARQGEKARPAKNRRMHSVQIFCENPEPSVNSAARGAEIT